MASFKLLFRPDLLPATLIGFVRFLVLLGSDVANNAKNNCGAGEQDAEEREDQLGNRKRSDIRSAACDGDGHDRPEHSKRSADDSNADAHPGCGKLPYAVTGGDII